MAASSLARKVGVASLIMMVSVFLSRVMGLVREMVIAWAAGAGGSVDAYQVAFILPEILNHVVASGFLSVTFIPIFTRHLSEGREAAGWEIFSVILTVFGGVLLLLIAVSVAFTPQIVRWLAPGITDPEIFAGAVTMTRIILPAQFFFFAGGMFMAVQFAKERFAIPALAPLVYNLGIIIGGVALGPVLGMEGFSWGVLGGAFVGNFALQWWGAKKVGMRFCLCANFRHPELSHYVRLTLPLMVGLTMSFSTEVFFKLFGSFLPPGGISALNYGIRVMLMLVGFLGQAIGVASFPFMARLAAENRLDEMNRLLNGTLRSIALVIPLSVLVMVLRREVVTLLFYRGRFDLAAVEMTSGLLLYLMAGAFAFAAQTVVVRGFYAVQNTLFPAIFGSIAVAATLPLYFSGIRFFGANGVALAVCASAVAQVWLLFFVWNRKSGNREARAVYGFYGKMLLVSLPMGAGLEWARRFLAAILPETALAGPLFMCAAIGLVFLFLFSLVGMIFNIEEIRSSLRRIVRRLPRPFGR